MVKGNNVWKDKASISTTLNMAQILELWEILNNYGYVLRVLMEKVSSMQEEMDDVSREKKTLRENWKGMLEI